METTRPSLLLTALIGSFAGLGISGLVWICSEHKLMNNLFAYLVGGTIIGAVASSSGYKISELRVLTNKTKDLLGIEEGDEFDYVYSGPDDEKFEIQEPEFQNPNQNSNSAQPKANPIPIPLTPPIDIASNGHLSDPWEEVESSHSETSPLIDTDTETLFG